MVGPGPAEAWQSGLGPERKSAFFPFFFFFFFFFAILDSSSRGRSCPHLVPSLILFLYTGDLLYAKQTEVK